MLKVYGASKLKHAPLWIRLREEWEEIYFIARWPTLHVGKTPDDECFAKVFWQHDAEDVCECDVVLVYADPNDHLRGALVEAGMGIAFDKEIVVVGDHPDYGTWRYHSSVHRVKDLDSARMLLRALAMDIGDH